MNEFRRTSTEFSAAAPRISLYDDDGYAAENPLHEGPLDWSGACPRRLLCAGPLVLLDFGIIFLTSNANDVAVVTAILSLR